MNFFSKIIELYRRPRIPTGAGLPLLNGSLFRKKLPYPPDSGKAQSLCLYSQTQVSVLAELRAARYKTIAPEHMATLFRSNGLEKYLYYPWPSEVTTGNSLLKVRWGDDNYDLAVGLAVVEPFTDGEAITVVITFRDASHDIKWKSDITAVDAIDTIRLDDYKHIFADMKPYNVSTYKRDGSWVDSSGGASYQTREPPPEKDGYLFNNLFK